MILYILIHVRIHITHIMLITNKNDHTNNNAELWAEPCPAAFTSKGGGATRYSRTCHRSVFYESPSVPRNISMTQYEFSTFSAREDNCGARCFQVFV